MGGIDSGSLTLYVKFLY